jgi:anti-sigma factor (TIGR02949 family)
MTEIDCRADIKCRETHARIHRYLDRDLTPDEMAEVRAHLERCPDCAKHFRFEHGVITTVGSICRKVQAPPTLVAKVHQCRCGTRETRPADAPSISQPS